MQHATPGATTLRVAVALSVAVLIVLAMCTGLVIAAAPKTPIRPVDPGALALGPHGELFIADDDLNEILAMSSDGRFRVVAGNGHPGFSGDGGPAWQASLSDPQGMTFAANGTLYVADAGNNRIRKITSAGEITTVAGNGHYGWVQNRSPALAAPLGSPVDVALDSRGSLFIAAQGSNEILRLSNGTVQRIAGSRRSGGTVGLPATAFGASPDGPDGLAFDNQGNLLVTGSNTKSLLLLTTRGILREFDRGTHFYPRGAGGIRRGTNQVTLMDDQAIIHVESTGLTQTIVSFASKTFDGGRLTGFQPNGLALADDGTIWVDTNTSNGSATRPAIIRYKLGTIRLVWVGPT